MPVVRRASGLTHRAAHTEQYQDITLHCRRVSPATPQTWGWRVAHRNRVHPRTGAVERWKVREGFFEVAQCQIDIPAKGVQGRDVVLGGGVILPVRPTAIERLQRQVEEALGLIGSAHPPVGRPDLEM